MPDLDRAALVARDRALVQARDRTDRTRFVGLDISADALAYACEAGFLDAAVHADLERDDPTAEQRALLGAADLVISTGCIGYVTERTLVRIATATPPPAAAAVDGAHGAADVLLRTGGGVPWRHWATRPCGWTACCGSAASPRPRSSRRCWTRSPTSAWIRRAWRPTAGCTRSCSSPVTRAGAF